MVNVVGCRMIVFWLNFLLIIPGYSMNEAINWQDDNFTDATIVSLSELMNGFKAFVTTTAILEDPATIICSAKKALKTGP